VETFIIFRSITPLAVSLIDAVFRPYISKLPSLKTASALLLIFFSACLYAMQDSELSVLAYTWGSAYVVILCVEIVRTGAFVCPRLGRHIH